MYNLGKKEKNKLSKWSINNENSIDAAKISEFNINETTSLIKTGERWTIEKENTCVRAEIEGRKSALTRTGT